MPKSTTKRLFFALWPDDHVRARLHQWQKSLDLSAGRLLHAADLHMTLQYLGPIPAERLDCVKMAATRVRAVPVPLQIDSVRYWRRPRVLCAGVAHMPDELQSLVQQLGECLTVCGFAPESRAYRPHVTLARKVDTRVSYDLPDAILWQPSDFVLVQSHTDGQIPRYEPIARFLLDPT